MLSLLMASTPSGGEIAAGVALFLVGFLVLLFVFAILLRMLFSWAFPLALYLGYGLFAWLQQQFGDGGVGLGVVALVLAFIIGLVGAAKMATQQS